MRHMRKSLILIALAFAAIASATEPGGYGVSMTDSSIALLQLEP